MAILSTNKTAMLVLTITLSLCMFRLIEGLPCIQLQPKPNNIVCVCNNTYCDTVPSAEKLPKGQYVVFTTSQSGMRFEKQVYEASNESKSDIIIRVNINETRQKIIGFGGAFTDAAGINIASLPSGAQDMLINSYFSKDGIEYTVGRVPMASCDFSTHPYSYDDVPGDLNLTKFALAQEDFKYKIPFIIKALNVSPNPVKIFGSPWSAPAWMKTNKNMTGDGALIGQPGGQYYKTWAMYFVKFLQEYGKHNISFWGLTAQNEPIDGLEKDFPFQCMGYTPEQQRDFIKLDLGPALQKAGYKNIKLMMLDDQRLFVLKWAETILADPDAAKYVSGIAVHWYLDGLVPSVVLSDTHKAYPDKFIFGTEACYGSVPWEKITDIGPWHVGASYANDIIADLNNWVTGWTDWNIALDLKGGPNWVNNFDDSPIRVNAEKKEFYKQPTFYVMGHFSKYIVPGSVWIATESTKPSPLIETTAFLRPDNSVAIVIHNLGYETMNITLGDGGAQYRQVTSLGHSIQTVIWWLS